MDISIIESQFILFIPPKQRGSFEGLAARIRDKVKIKFKHPALSMPLPPHAPAEIPRVVLSSQQDDQQIQISLNRVNLVRLFSKRNSLEDVTNFAETHFEPFFDSITLDSNPIQRIAFVIRMFAKPASPSDFLRKRFMITGLEGVTELGLKFNFPKSIKGFEINDHHQYDNGVDTEDNRPGILIVRDINTVAGKKTVFSKSEARSFLQMAIEEIKTDYIDLSEKNNHG